MKFSMTGQEKGDCLMEVIAVIFSGHSIYKSICIIYL